jgi:TolB-like protein/DNA-binding winged helix-turn-helix (wHTH) protein/Tfp pilus assembly protein PilF
LFEDFRLDRRSGLFRRDNNGTVSPVPIGSRALDILRVLIERAGEVVSKDEIVAAVWPGIVVEDSNLPVQISALRWALDRGRSQGSLIQTVSGRGYRFVAAVTRPAAETSSVASSISGDAQDKVDGAPVLSTSKMARMVLHRRRTTIVRLAAATAAVSVLVLGVWWLWPVTKHSPTSELLTATSIAQPLVAPRMSIVVLPFINLSNDPEQQYFADGITDNLTTDLSRLAFMFVISRNSAFTYRNKLVDTKQIGRELGVRYVLEGSVQRSGTQVRVNAQLIDAETGGHLRVQQFDRGADDLFALQDEITRRIALALNLELIDTEAARPMQNPDALDYLLRGLAAQNKPPSRENYAEAMSAFERALALDPSSVDAQSRLAILLADRILDFGADSADDDIQRADMLANQALTAAPRRPLTHYSKAEVLRAQRRCREAVPEYETVVALDRNAASALAHIGRCKIYIGPIEEAIPILEEAIRLNPRDPYIGNQYYRIGEAHLLQSQIDEAIGWLERGRNAAPELSHIHAYLSSAYALEGETQRAAAELAEARRLAGEGYWRSMAQLRAGTRYEAPAIQALAEATYYAGLRKAGVPEE